MRKLVWAEFSSDSANPELALLISPRTQSLLLACIDYIQREYVWVGNFDEIDAALGDAVKEILEENNMPIDCNEVAACLSSPEAITVLQDIIINNQSIVNSITNTVNKSGFGSPDNINIFVTTIKDRQKDGTYESEVKELENCNLDRLWAGIRHGIVQRLDDAARDLLETIVPIGDASERFQVFFDLVPIVGDAAEGLAFQVSQVAPDLLNLYDAYSSEATMDEIACDIFEMVCAQCRYPTFQELAEYYLSFGIAGLDNPKTAIMNDVFQALVDSANALPKAAYHTLIYWELLVLNMEAAFGGSSGTEGISRFAALGESSANNNWLQLCSSCNTQYRVMIYDFTQSSHNTYPDSADNDSTDNGVYVNGMGWRLANFGTGQRAEFAMPFNPNWRVRAIAWRSTQSGLLTGRTTIFRPLAGSNANSQAQNLSNGTGEYNNCREGLLSITGFNELGISAQMGVQTQSVYINKLAIVFDAAYAPEEAQPTNSQTLCTF